MKRLLFVIFAISALAGCAKDQPKEDVPSIRVTHETLTFNYKETSYSIVVRTDSPWTLSSDSPWLSTSISGADYSTPVTIIAQKNEGTSRKGAITFSNSTGKATLTVTQNADNRNYLDITAEGMPGSYEKLEDACIVIPYRNGKGEKLSKLTASVAGTSKGSICVETKENVVLEQGAGQIRLKLSGRAGGAGYVLFTISGLPSSVYGEATQCSVVVEELEPLKDITLAQLKALGNGKIQAHGRTSATVTAGKSITGGVVLQDKTAGIKVMADSFPDVTPGNVCEIYLKGCSLGEEEGVRTLYLSDFQDMSITGDEDVPSPISLSAPDFSPYEMMLCCVDLTQVAEDDIAKPLFSGSTRMSHKGWKDGFLMYVKTGSPLEKAALKTGNGRLCGLVGKTDGGKYALMPRDEQDVEDLKGARIDFEATFEVEKDTLSGIAAAGQKGVKIILKSSVNWTLSSDDTGWIDGWSAQSGAASADPQEITLNVSENKGPRRRATITISGKNVPDLKVKVIQLEGAPILDCDMSLVKESLKSTPKYYPADAGVDVSKNFASLGLSGWYATAAYASLDETGEKGVLRVGKTYSKGYLESPKLTPIGSVPTEVEVSFLAGKYKKSTADWIGLEIIGDGEIVVGTDVIKIEEYDNHYTSTLIESLPCYVAHSMNNTTMKQVTFRIKDATENTAIRFTATRKGDSTAQNTNLFFVGDIHVRYVD